MRRLCPKSVSSTWSKPKYGPCHSSSTRAEPSTDSILPGRQEREARREVRLAEHRGAVPGAAEQRRDRPLGRVGRQIDAVAGHAVGRRIGAGQDRRPRRLAQRVLRAGGGEASALRGERVEPRRRAERRSLDPERVGALLVGRDQQDVHGRNYAPGPRGGARWKLCARPTSASRRSPTSRSPRTTSRCPSGDGGDAARPLPRRGPADGGGRAAHARRAVVVLPVPQDDPDPHRRRASGASRPTSWASAAPTSRPTRRLHVRAPRRVDARRAVRRARPARRHARVPGLGRPDRAAARRRAPRPVRACRRGQHVPAHGRPAARRGVPQLAALLADRRGLRRRLHRRQRLPRPRSPPTWSPRTTRRSPTTRYKAGARQFPMLVPTSPDDPGVGREPQGVGDAARVDQAVPHRVLRQGSRSRAAATARSSATFPAAPASRTPPSRAAATSCRKTAASSSPGSSRAGSPASSVDASTSSRCSTRCAPSRRPACTTRPIRSTAIATSSSSRSTVARVRRPVRPRRRRGARPLRGRCRLRHRQGRRRRRDLRRARPRSCSCAASTTTSGASIAGWVDAERDARADRRARDRRGGRPRRRASTELVGVFAAPGRRRTATRTASCRSCTSATCSAASSARSRTRCARSRGGRSTTSTTGTTTTRCSPAPRSKRTGGARPAGRRRAARAPSSSLAEAVCLTLVARSRATAGRS